MLYTEKTMENLRNTVSVKLVNNENDYLKCTSKPSYMSHKIFHIPLVAIRKSKLALVAIRKSKFALKLDKPAFIGICILELIKVLM